MGFSLKEIIFLLSAINIFPPFDIIHLLSEWNADEENSKDSCLNEKSQKISGSIY